MIARLRGVAGDDAGTTLVEYALIMALVSMVSYGALMAIGDVLVNFFNSSSSGLANVAEIPK